MEFYANLQDYQRAEIQKLENLLRDQIPEVGIITRVLQPDFHLTKDINKEKYSITHEAESLLIDECGIVDSRHYSRNRWSTGREKELFEKGSRIRQHRHIFAVSDYDCQVLTAKVGVDITPELLGANLVIGRPDTHGYSLSALPQGTHLAICAADATQAKPPLAVLVKYVEQKGCGITGNAIQAHYKDKSLTKKFIEHSQTNRGIVLSVEYPAEKMTSITPGQKVFFKFPKGTTM